MALKIDFLVTYDRESIKAELRRIARVTKKRTVSQDDIEKHGRVCATTVMKKFGTLHHANEAAGLIPGAFRGATDQDLLKIVVDLWRITEKKFGRSPLKWELREYGLPVSGHTIVRRFGSWRRALFAASRMVNHPPKPDAEPANAKRKSGIKRKRAQISVRRRFLIFRRDEYTCQMCRQKGGELHVDHVIPFSRGGSDNMENLQTLCRDCNIGKRGSLE